MKRTKKENYLEQIPEKIPHLEWSEKKGIVTLHWVHKGFYDKIAQKFFHRPKISYVDLDPYGSFVWKQIDGKRNILEIGKAAKEEFGDEIEPLYERLSKYVYTLKQEKFITLKKKDKKVHSKSTE